MHLGHMILAEYALEELKLNKLFFIPAYIAPLKSQRGLVSSRHRLTMLKLALKGKKKFFISDIECKRGGVSYTVDTLRSFSKVGIELFFITGSDSLSALKRWKDFASIQKLATFVVARRPGFSSKGFKPGIRFMAMPQVDISSSQIRRRLKSRRPVDYWLAPGVLAYINKNKLYQ